ncbi:MAG: SDR family oxidoreductase [Actinomycetota bacterium]|nr:MAG: SDR family oxidoreductase [Actinomycetota bacterium]
MAAARYPFRTALVTGASSGIGEEMARLLGAAGVPTVVVARRKDRLRELADEYPGVEVLVADLTTTAGRAAVAGRIADPARPLDLVVNNAGFGTSGLFHELDADRLDREVTLNVAALTQLSRAALGVMVPRKRGWLLNVASVAAFQPAPGLAVYAATKAYVTSLTESLHEEVRGTGVRVTALCPGLTRTEFQSISNYQGAATRYPDLAWTSVQDVARSGLDDVAHGKALSVPGLLYKGMVAASQVLPNALKRRITGVALGRR